jgi:hypothetical protein
MLGVSALISTACTLLALVQAMGIGNLRNQVHGHPSLLVAAAFTYTVTSVWLAAILDDEQLRLANLSVIHERFEIARERERLRKLNLERTLDL